MLLNLFLDMVDIFVEKKHWAVNVSKIVSFQDSSGVYNQDR